MEGALERDRAPPPYQAEPPPYQAEPPPYESLPLPSPPSFSTAISEAHTDSLSYFSSVSTSTGQNPEYPLSNLERWTGEPPPGYFQPYCITVEPPQPRVPSPDSVTEHTRSRCQQLTSLEFSQVETRTPSLGSMVRQTSPRSVNQNSLAMSGGRRREPSSCLIWSIIAFILFPILGFASIIVSIKVKLHYRRGNIAKAQEYSSCVSVLNGCTILIGIIFSLALITSLLVTFIHPITSAAVASSSSSSSSFSLSPRV